MSDDEPDKILIQRSLQGETPAYETLVIRYQDRLVHSMEQALGSREDAQDAAQQAFISGWRKLASFREDAAFYSWIYRIAMNAAMSTRRKRRLSTTSLESRLQASGYTPADENSAAEPDHRLLGDERVRLVQAALQRVAEDFRTPLVMKEIDGFSYEEIAQVLEIPIGTVRSRIFRARREMSEHLQRLFGDD